MSRMLLLFSFCLAVGSSSVQAIANDSRVEGVIVMHTPESVAANLSNANECPVNNICEQPCTCFQDTDSQIVGAVACSCVPMAKGPFAIR